MPYILLLIMLSACSSMRIDKEFTSYVQSFEVIAAKHNINTYSVSTDFDKSLPQSQMGVCHYRSGAPNKILINPNHWYNIDPNCREALIFHEMTHCALGLNNHNETLFIRKAILDCKDYNRKKDIKALFNDYKEKY